MNLKKILKNELIDGHTPFDWFWLGFGLTMQIIAIVYGFITGTPDSTISIISGLTGVISVVYCAQGKISFYAWAYIQMFTYTFGVALPNHLWGEAWENLFYFITQTIGIFIWQKAYKRDKNSDSTEVKANKLGKIGWVITLAALIIGTTVLTIILKKTSDPLPFMDAISTVPAFIARFLMCFNYREQWLHWLIIDITSAIMFAMLGNWVMLAQFIFWTANCVYGYIKWNKSVKNQNYVDI